MGVMDVLRDSGLDMSSGYMGYCRSRDVDWVRYALSWFSCDFSICKVFDILLRSASSTWGLIAHGEPIGDSIVPSGPARFCTRGPCSVSHTSGASKSVVVWPLWIWGPGSEEPWKVPEVGYFHPYAADAEVDGDCDLVYLTAGPYLGHLASVCVDYDQLWEKS